MYNQAAMLFTCLAGPSGPNRRLCHIPTFPRNRAPIKTFMLHAQKFLPQRRSCLIYHQNLMPEALESTVR